MLLYIHYTWYTKRFALFQGEKYSNRNNVSLLARFLLAGKIAGKESRQQHVAVAENNSPSLKKARMLRCAVRWGRLKRPVGPGQQFFSRHKNDPLKTETRRRAWAPQRSPLKSECLGVPILPVWPENEKMFSSYRLLKKVVTGQNRAKVTKVDLNSSRLRLGDSSEMYV